MNAVLFARLNTLTITSKIHSDRSCQSIHLASRPQAHSLHQCENLPTRLQLASTAPFHHHHLLATGLHHMQVRHLFVTHIQRFC